MPKTVDTLTVEHCETLEGVGAKLDRDASILRAVKLIGHDSKNGRAYPPETLRAAVSHYEGVRVNVDHPDGSPGSPRRVADRMGVITNARYVEGHGIYGDFRFNPKHTLTEQVLWDAENNPAAVGFSHNATLRIGPKRNNRTVVEAIVGVRSVDLVADPATTASLFEHDASEGIIAERFTIDKVLETACDLLNEAKWNHNKLTPEERRAAAVEVARDLINELTTQLPEGEDMALKDLTLESLKAERPDLVTALESQSNETSELESLQAELATLKAEKKARETADAIEAELVAAKLDPKNEKHVSPAFRRVLSACETTEERAELIADRAALVTESVSEPVNDDQKAKPGSKPVTTPATEGITADITPEEFARRLRTR